MLKLHHLFTFLLPVFSYAQVTLKIIALPENSPENEKIYLAGSINNWNPADEGLVFEKDEKGYLSLTIPEGKNGVEFKLTLGSWEKTEGNKQGENIKNRSFLFTGMPQILEICIENWIIKEEKIKKNTAASNVQILSEKFFMPQLNRERRIWLYLPPDYYISAKTYPVLYMHDGQNLFDESTSYAGEWQVDETLNKLFEQGDFGAIVVGIDNGASFRINEYTPWANTQYGGGEGDTYIDFIAKTLKPYIDSNFRTKKEAASNALIGSSLGALISTYGGIKYPEIFGKIGNMSPAFWFNEIELNTFLTSTKNPIEKLKFYFVCGEKESEQMVADMKKVHEKLLLKGVLPENTFIKVHPEGTHSESFWQSEFESLYLFLFR